MHVIYDPVFSHSDGEILFVSQLNIPSVGNDGPLRKKYVDSVLKTIDKKPRYADPLVSILNLKTKRLMAIDYGWSPDFSANDSLIVYSFQTQEISEFRVLASTLDGNSIKLYNRTTNKSETIAYPTNTYLLSPIFLDSDNILYQTGNTVNGAYGGGVALQKLNLSTKKSEFIHKGKKSYGEFHFIGGVYKRGNNFYYTLYIPRDSFGTYSHQLWSGSGMVHDFGKNKFKKNDEKFGVNAEGALVFLDDERQLITDKRYLRKYKNGKQVLRKELTTDYYDCYLSPDGKTMLYTTETAIYIMETDNFKATKLDLPDSEIFYVKWLKDCKRLAIVQYHPDVRDTDILTLFEIK